MHLLEILSANSLPIRSEIDAGWAAGLELPGQKQQLNERNSASLDGIPLRRLGGLMVNRTEVVVVNIGMFDPSYPYVDLALGLSAVVTTTDTLLHNARRARDSNDPLVFGLDARRYIDPGFNEAWLIPLGACTNSYDVRKEGFHG